MSGRWSSPLHPDRSREQPPDCQRDCQRHPNSSAGDLGERPPPVLESSSMGPSVATAMDWTAVTAWAAWAAVAVYVVLGIFAWIQVLQARKLREEQARPFVIVDFEPGFLVYLTVENLGRTMARDVSIQFDKPLESTLSGTREIDESPLFREPIPTLPPGKKIRVLFDQYAARMEAKLPLTYDVTLATRDRPARRSGNILTG
jgi:hypothetical protein